MFFMIWFADIQRDREMGNGMGLAVPRVFDETRRRGRSFEMAPPFLPVLPYFLLQPAGWAMREMERESPFFFIYL